MSKKIIKELQLELELTKLDIKETKILIRKYEKKISKEKIKKQEKQLRFNSIEEVQEAFGYGDISEKEYRTLCNYFENIENEKTINEVFLEHLKRNNKEDLRHLKYLEQELFDEELVETARN